MLPSTHYAWEIRKRLDAFDYYVIRLYLEHPELDLSSSWAIDMVQTLESCAEDLIIR